MEWWRDSKPHSWGVKIISIHDARGAELGAVGKFGYNVEAGCLGRGHVLEHARERIIGMRWTECDQVVPLEIDACICIFDVSDVVAPVPINNDAILHSELKVRERDGRTSICNEVPIDPQFNVY